MREKGGSFAVPFKDFSDFFFRATSHRPYPYQRHLAEEPLKSRLIHVPAPPIITDSSPAARGIGAKGSPLLMPVGSKVRA